jgi:hypothetical protein
MRNLLMGGESPLFEIAGKTRYDVGLSPAQPEQVIQPGTVDE